MVHGPFPVKVQSSDCGSIHLVPEYEASVGAVGDWLHRSATHKTRLAKVVFGGLGIQVVAVLHCKIRQYFLHNLIAD